MKLYFFFKNITRVLALACIIAGATSSCTPGGDGKSAANASEGFKYQAETFADVRVLRYEVPGFVELELQNKKLCYYLYEAALAGRDMIWDQNYKHNLCIRRTFENILQTYKGDKTTKEFEQFQTYAKQVFFSNGIHHHYSNMKLNPEFNAEYFKSLVDNSDAKGFPLAEGETLPALVAKLSPVLFDKTVDAKKVNKGQDVDIIAASATNFYENVTRQEVEDFYKKMKKANSDAEPSYGLNSKLIKENGVVKEKIWKVGGMYDGAITKVVFWLEKAITVAENENQKKALSLLVEYYKTGDLAKFDDYNIAWVSDTASVVDVVNGFIEVYGDPLGMKGSFESVVSIKDMEASKRIAAISKEAQWFEDNSPILPNHKKENVTGISAKVITVVVESGDGAPSTPIGINLPNSNWIRDSIGSKSVNLANIVHAYDESGKGSGMLEEFCFSSEEIKLAKDYGSLSSNLHTDMHEVIGHASGKLEKGTDPEAMKNYASTLEEARADLVALYYVMDPKLVEIGVMPSTDVGKNEYNSYIRNGLMTQLFRLKPGENLEEDHMRNRQLVAMYCFEKGKADNVIERKSKEGKTFFVINDYAKLRILFGDLLREIQRIKSIGDFEAGKKLVETYGVIVDQALLTEVHERVKKLNIAPYKGFIQPKLTAVMSESGEITDVKIEYPTDFLEQMLFLGKHHSFLPTYN